MRNYEILYIIKEFVVFVWYQVFSQEISFRIRILESFNFMLRNALSKLHIRY